MDWIHCNLNFYRTMLTLKGIIFKILKHPHYIIPWKPTLSIPDLSGREQMDGKDEYLESSVDSPCVFTSSSCSLETQTTPLQAPFWLQVYFSPFPSCFHKSTTIVTNNPQNKRSPSDPGTDHQGM